MNFRRVGVVILVIAALCVLLWPSSPTGPGTQSPNVTPAQAQQHTPSSESPSQGTGATSSPNPSASTQASIDFIAGVLTLDAPLPDLPGDTFITGIVVNPKQEPVAGALVRFVHMDDELKNLGGALSNFASSIKQGYIHGEATDFPHYVTGRSKAVVTGKDGRFRVRWPRVVPEKARIKTEVPKIGAGAGQRSMSMGMKVSTSSPDTPLKASRGELEVTADEWGVMSPSAGPRALRAAHNNFLPAQKDVNPGDEVTLVLGISGGVRVKTLDAAGSPLSGVTVRLEESGLDLKRLTTTALTDAAGSCQLLLPPGEITLVVSDEVHAPQIVKVVIPSEGLVDKTVTLTQGLFVIGRVVTKGGAPLEGATLNLTPDYSKGQGGMAINFNTSLQNKSTTSSHDGTFRLGPFGSSLPAEHLLTVSHPKHKGLRRLLGGSPDVGDLELAPSPHLEVRVRDEGGSPVAQARVWGEWIYDEQDFVDIDKDDGEKSAKLVKNVEMNFGVGAAEAESTNAEGMAKVWGEGKYRIHVEHPDFAPPMKDPEVEIGTDTPVLSVVLSRGFAVEVRVRSSIGEPLAGARVIFKREENEGSATERMMTGLVDAMIPDSDSAFVSTDVLGVCRVKRLAPGKHSITVTPPKGPKQKWFRSLDGPTQIDLQFDATGTFYGKVDPSLAGLAVLAGNGMGNVSAKIQPDGSWETEPLAPGRYSVILQDDSSDAMRLGLSMLKLALPGPDQKVLAAGERKEVILKASACGSLHLRVTNAAGQPHMGMLMAIKAGVKTGDMDVLDKIVVGAPGDEPGIHEFKRIPVGDWNIQSESLGGGQKLRIRVEAGSKLELVWALKAADAVLKGRVVGANGQGVLGALQLNLKDDEVPVAHTGLSKDGSFEMKNVVPGDYELRLTGAMGLGRKLSDVKLSPGAKDLGDIVLPAGVTLKGKVLPVGGDLPMGLMVKLVRGGSTVASALVELDGVFKLEGLEAAAGELQLGPMLGEPLSTTPWNGTDTEVTLEVPGEKW